MPRPKDAKIWNEDLVEALDARFRKAQREGKRDLHLWRKGRDDLQAVRKDIYRFRTGTIVNLPSNLKKKVQRLCEDIIHGITSVYPDGHVPTTTSNHSNDRNRNNSSATASPHPSTPLTNPNNTTATSNDDDNGSNSNPFRNDHYMKRIKIRGGAYAILMAFHYSTTEILTKRDICREGQKFCDEQMESNWHAGRAHGAWSGIATLKSRSLVKEQGYATYSTAARGFRDRPHTYSLTRDGELFLEALLSHRPEAAAEAARNAAAAHGGRDPRSPSLGGTELAGTMLCGTPASFHGNYPTPGSGGRRNSANMETDRTELQEWIDTARLGDCKEFKVGKERRFRLHKLCDALQRQRPGLLLTHSSSGTSRSRTLSIRLVSRPALPSLAAARSPPPSSIAAAPPAAGSRKRPRSLIDRSGTTAGASPSGLAAREMAGRAALLRQEKAREETELKMAILESKKMAATSPSRKKAAPKGIEQQQAANDGESGDEEAKNPPAVKKTLFAIDDSSNSDDDDDVLPEPSPFSPSAIRGKRKRNHPGPGTKNHPARNPGEICCIDSDSDDGDETLTHSVDVLSRGASVRKNGSAKPRTEPSAVAPRGMPKAAKTGIIDLCESGDDDNDVEENLIEIREILEEPIDLTVWIDNRERNRNATPRTLRMELQRHLRTGPLSGVWPRTLLPYADVEEVGLEWGDIQYSVRRSNSPDQPKRRLGVSIERKRVNDLVQRSSTGDHLVQLFRMKEHCSLSVLLIENDARTAQGVTPYNAQEKEGFDPLGPTIKCEDDIYRMFGRIMLSVDSVKFLQTRDEQSSLRAIGALGLMAVFAPSRSTKELKGSEKGASANSNGVQALCDRLKQAGIPWRLAKRVASVVGGPTELEVLYGSCCNETAKSLLLSHIIATGEDQNEGDLRSSASGWSDAIYRIIAPQPSSSEGTKLSGEAALLMHKELINDHGVYLSTLYRGNSPEEALEKVLDNPASSSAFSTEMSPRHVIISLTSEQATKYFSPNRSGGQTFYKLSILSDGESKSHPGAITMQTVSRSFASKAFSVFEFEGSNILDLIRDSWSREGGKNFVSLAKTVARLVDNTCHEQGRGRSSCGTKRILMVCGLQPALDANAKKTGYMVETRAVVDLVFAELLLCYDLTILQAPRKNPDDRVNLVKQLALACFHCGFLVQHRCS